MNATLRKFRQAAAARRGEFAERRRLHAALAKYERTRAATTQRFQDWESARSAAAAIKWDAIEHLDAHLAEFADRLAARGAVVHWATDAAAAQDKIIELLNAHGVKRLVKSKCMTTEEIHLNDALEAAGFHVVETDLGEFIVQLRRESPYHFVCPAIHLRREAIGELFHEKLGCPETSDPAELTIVARRRLRDEYLQADAGLTGANFGVAETGMISVTENEGNARLCMALPRLHVVLLGIEKIIPRLADLALFLPMLATAGTGQAITCYNSMVGGPRGAGEPDGPREMHVILLDNGRTRLLADPEQRDALRCIRCGACLNVCPIFKNIGGHAYGTTYQGPIGSVITPHLRGLDEWKHLPYASSLCGACTQTCPVRIDLHHHLLRNRRNAVRASGRGLERAIFGVFAWVMQRPWAYRWAGWLGRLAIRWTRPMRGTIFDPLRAWRGTRELPKPPRRTFGDYWRERNR